MVYSFYKTIAYLKNERIILSEKHQQLMVYVKQTILFDKFKTYAAEELKLPLAEEKKPIQKLKKALYSEIIGQKHAIDKLCNILSVRKGNDHPSTEIKPLSFLFVGPTGIGKTQLAKELSKAVYDNTMITLSMENYQQEHEASVLRGAPPGFVGSDKVPLLAVHCEKNLTGEKTHDDYKILKPCVWLLDEFEKAHKSIKEAFLGILDEGKFSYKNSTTEGRYCFKNCVFIATSNWLALEIIQMYNLKMSADEIETGFLRLK